MKGMVRGPAMAWLVGFVPIIGVFWSFYHKMVILGELKAYLDDESINPVMEAIVYPLLSCGFYSFYTPFRLGALIERAQQKANLPDAANPAMTLFLMMFLCGLSRFKTQAELNRAWEA